MSQHLRRVCKYLRPVAAATSGCSAKNRNQRMKLSESFTADEPLLTAGEMIRTANPRP
jgi:hypothetical protein